MLGGLALYSLQREAEAQIRLVVNGSEEQLQAHVLWKAQASRVFTCHVDDVSIEEEVVAVGGEKWG
jgi:hypothetical protein